MYFDLVFRVHGTEASMLVKGFPQLKGYPQVTRYSINTYNIHSIAGRWLQKVLIEIQWIALRSLLLLLAVGLTASSWLMLAFISTDCTQPHCLQPPPQQEPPLTIFVSVASYRDPECKTTMQACLDSLHQSTIETVLLCMLSVGRLLMPICLRLAADLSIGPLLS